MLLRLPISRLLLLCIVFGVVGFSTTGVLQAAACFPPATPQVTGFPNNLGGKSSGYGSPKLADLDGTGKLEILIGDGGAATGSGPGLFSVINVDGTIRWQRTLINSVSSTPAVGDITGDGKPDIVVSVGTPLSPARPGAVYAFSADGTLLPGWPFTPAIGLNGTGMPGGVYGSPTIADINSDGLPEVIFGGYDGYVHALNGHGQEIPGWPVFVRDTIWSSPAVGDLNGDGHQEVVIGTDAHQEGPPYNTVNGGTLRVFNGDGTPAAGWEQPFNEPDETIMSSPALADLAGDGKLEIIVGTGEYYSISTGQPRGHRVHVLRGDKTYFPGWPQTTGGYMFSSPAIGDIDGDGKPDIVIGSNDKNIYAWHSNGTAVKGFPMAPKDWSGNTWPINNSPILADYDGDPAMEVFIPVNTDVAVIKGTGQQLTYGCDSATTSFYGGTTLSNSAAIGKLTGTGSTDLVAAGGPGLHVWPLPRASGAASWPEFRGNTRNTGVNPALLTPSSPIVLVKRGSQATVQVAVKSTIGPITWTATSNQSWLTLSPTTGSTPGMLSVILRPGPLQNGTYTGTVTLSGAGVPNVTFTVSLIVVTDVFTVYLPLSQR